MRPPTRRPPEAPPLVHALTPDDRALSRGCASPSGPRAPLSALPPARPGHSAASEMVSRTFLANSKEKGPAAGLNISALKQEMTSHHLVTHSLNPLRPTSAGRARGAGRELLPPADGPTSRPRPPTARGTVGAGRACTCERGWHAPRDTGWPPDRAV